MTKAASEAASNHVSSPVSIAGRGSSWAEAQDITCGASAAGECFRSGFARRDWPPWPLWRKDLPACHWLPAPSLFWPDSYGFLDWCLASIQGVYRLHDEAPRGSLGCSRVGFIVDYRIRSGRLICAACIRPEAVSQTVSVFAREAWPSGPSDLAT